MNRSKIDNYRTAWAEAVKSYQQKVSRATYEDKIKAMAAQESVAEAEQDYMISIDFSHFYNTGYTYAEMQSPNDECYRQWVKDWGLPDPSGEKPQKPFRPYD